MSLRVIYAGTPDFSVPALAAIHQSKHQIVGVYTQPDRKSGRGKKITSSPIKNYALENNLDVFQPESLKTETALNELINLNADIMVVTAYGLILPQSILDALKLGCINIHASLLPRWRGAAPIQRAIEASDSETGITFMQMDSGLDTGDILRQDKLSLNSSINASILHDELMILGAQHIESILNDAENDALKKTKQDGNLSTYAQKLSKAESHINWAKTATIIEHKIRAFTPWPGASCKKNGQLIKILNASLDESKSGTPGSIINHDKTGLYVACGSSSLHITKIQLAGKKPVNCSDLYNSKNWTGESFDPLD